MTRHLPTEAHVQHKWDQYRDACERNGQRPSVLGLAAQLELSNTTFRRHFPILAKEIATHRALPACEADGRPSPYDVAAARNARLRRANRTLSEQLRLAVAQIQRLGIENAQLRRAIESSTNVTRIDRPDRPRPR